MKHHFANSFLRVCSLKISNEIFSRDPDFAKFKELKTNSIQVPWYPKTFTNRFWFHVKTVSLTYIYSYCIDAGIILSLSRHQYAGKYRAHCPAAAAASGRDFFRGFRVCARARGGLESHSRYLYKRKRRFHGHYLLNNEFLLDCRSGPVCASCHLDLLTSSREYPPSNHAEM